MSPRELVTTFYERIWNAGDETAAELILSPSLRFRGSLGVQATGPAEFTDYVRMVRASLADYRCDIVETVHDGNRCFARMRFTGRHVAEFLGVPATGKTLSWEGAALFHCEPDLITDVWVLGDVAGLKEQLR